jgi:hypothetical protein
MSTVNILVLTIVNLVKIVRKFRSLSHSSCTIFFVDPQGIIEIYYCLYLLDLNKHPGCPQISNELYLHDVSLKPALEMKVLKLPFFTECLSLC